MAKKPKLTLAKVGRRAAIYLRKSTDAQEASIPGQRKAVHEYAEKHGYEVVAEFVDSGISGVDSASERPKFLEMIEAARRRQFDYVVVWDMSRLTRSDPMDSMVELHPLRKSGVKVVTLDKGEVDWDSIGGILTTVVEAESNNQYVRKLARGTTRGQADLARSGRWVAGRPPLGYVVGSDRKLQLGPASEVAAVRWAFDAYASGKSLRGVQTGLAERGFEVVVSSVGWLLRNRLYAGDFVWGRNTQAKFFSVRANEITTSFDRGQTAIDDQIVVKDAHPAIVSRELFEQVQSMFAGRKRASTPLAGGGAFVLTGLLRCADCGYGMVGFRNKTSPDCPVFYRCGGSQTKGVNYCHPHMAPQAKILQSIFNAFQGFYANPETFSRLKAEAKRQLERAAATTDVKALEQELQAERARLTKAAKRLVEVDADLVDVVQGQVRTIRQNIDRLEQEMRTASVNISDVMLSIDERAQKAAELFNRISEVYRDADPTQLRAFLLEAIDHVKVSVSRSNATGRWRYTFEGGEIVMKQNADLFESWSSTKQVCLKLSAVA